MWAYRLSVIYLISDGACMMSCSWSKVVILAAVVSMLLSACGTGAEKHSDDKVTTLVYANLTDKSVKQGGPDRAAVSRFNRTHPNVKIEIRDYFDEEGSSGKSRLLTEMASGKIPDIIDLGEGSYGLSYPQLVRKGYLEDLWPYINGDPDLNEGQLWDAPLKAAEVDGELYALFSAVTISTLIGDEQIVGMRHSWNLMELQNALAAMPEDSTALEYYYTKSDMFPCIFGMGLDHYVNWETGETSFDNEAFRAGLEFINSFPDTFSALDFESGRERAEEEAADRVRNGQQMLSKQEIEWLPQVQALDKVYAHGGQVSFVGYPMEDGSAGSTFLICGRKLAMTSTCQDKAAAWEFLRQLLLPQIHNDNAVIGYYGFPVNRADFDRVKDVYTNLPSHVKIYYTYFNDTVEVKVTKVKPAEIERFEDFISYIDKVDLYDTTLYDIVWEAAGPYFAGDKTIDETVDLIEQRVKLYVNENR